jgi:DNA-binding transcriptional LysR family regulator
MSQPAMSHALTRARDLFHDRLLVRAGNEMHLTPRAQELLPQIEQILASMRNILDQRIFDPAAAFGKVRVRATEGAVLAVLPPVLAEILKHAPNVEVEISSHMSTAYSSLTSGDADIVLDVVDDSLGQGFETLKLFSNTLVCITCQETQLTEMTIENYLTKLHVAVEGGTNAFIERTLADQGIKRHIALTLPGFLTAASSVVHSSLILTMPRTLGERACELFPLRLWELPVNVPAVTLSLVWHTRNTDDPLQSWVRNSINQAALTIQNI